MSIQDRLQNVLDRESRSGGGSGMNKDNIWKPPKGRTAIRILPAPGKDASGNAVSPEEFFQPVGYHYNLKENNVPVVCPNYTFYEDESCPVCEALAAGDIPSDLYQKYRLVKRYVVQAIIRGKEADGPKYAILPVTVFTAIANILKEQEEWGNCLHPVKGRDFHIERSGEGLKTEYTTMPAAKQRPILSTREEIKALYEGMSTIREVINVDSPDEIEKLVRLANGLSVVGSSTPQMDDSFFGDDDDGDFDSFDAGDENPAVSDEEDDDLPFDASDSDTLLGDGEDEGDMDNIRDRLERRLNRS